MLFKRVAALLAMTLGVLGVAACSAGAYAVWVVGSRLERANEKAFATVDRGLAAAQERVRGAQKRVQESRITTSEITQSLRDWSTRKVEERLVVRLDIERRANTLGGHLRTVDSWLESSSETTQRAQDILELCRSLGGDVDREALDEVLATLASLRGTVQESEKTVDGIRAFAADKDGDEHRLARALKLLARIIATITDIDTRLDAPIARLGALRTDAENLKVRTSRYIFWTTLVCYLLLAWIAAGQLALCWCGWRGFWSGRPSTQTSEPPA